MRLNPFIPFLICVGLCACDVDAQQASLMPPAEEVETAALRAQGAPLRTVSHPELCIGTQNGSTTNGTRVILAPCDTKDNVTWQMADGVMRIGNSACLDVTGGATGNGAQLQLWRCTSGNKNQQFVGAMPHLVWRGKNKCIDVRGGQFKAGNALQLWDCDDNNDNQNWSASAIVPKPSETPAPSLEGQNPTDPACSAKNGRRVDVRTSDELKVALTQARAGDVIALADGTYPGNFKSTASGTQENPIALCGSPQAVLVGANFETGYTLHLDGANYWVLSGFAVTQGAKGVMLDGANNNRLVGLSVHDIGAEGIHLRKHSSFNVVDQCTVFNTGLGSNSFFGEGVYIGSAQSNWCKLTNGQADRSDNNTVSNCSINNTTSENIDIKEGTQNGILSGNTLDGGKILPSAATSNINIKGNGYTVSNNIITHAPEDAFSVHVVLAGWGACNRFTGNRANDNVPGYGIHIAAGKPLPVSRIDADNIFERVGKAVTNAEFTSDKSPIQCPEGTTTVRCP